jgi:cytochrome P450
VPPGSFSWLRASVARFSNGDDHIRRRALALSLLETVDASALQPLAEAETGSAIDRHGNRRFDAISLIAKTVPVTVLAGELGVRVDADALQVIALGLRPGAEAGREADAAVADALGGRPPDELEAARLGLLVQTCDATAGLIANAFLAAEPDVTRVIDRDPPVRSTRRLDSHGDQVVIDLAALGLPFGAGAHACPGRDHALALAAGVCSTLLARCVRTADEVIMDSAPNLQMPARLMVTLR